MTRAFLSDHLYARMHHRWGCQCRCCLWNGREECSEDAPCVECTKERDKEENRYVRYPPETHKCKFIGEYPK